METQGPGREPVTELLREWGKGDAAALDQLVPLVYEDLHRLARRRMQSMPAGATLQATALVNEVYLRLVRGADVRWQDRAHFFAIAARLMRQVAADNARQRAAAKRGGDLQRVAFELADVPGPLPDEELLALNLALDRLAEMDARKARVVELRFFAGLENAEIAEVLGVSVDTVKRDWNFSKLWLAREMA